MKELKAKTRHIRVVKPLCNRSQSLPGVETVRGVSTAIQVLQPKLPQENVPQRGSMGWQRLAAQAELINRLSRELEQAMFELKAIATEVNYDQRSIQATKKPTKSACEYLTALVPCVRRKKAGAFVLTTRTVDLFRAEREAVQIAQTLRCRARRRVVSR